MHEVLNEIFTFLSEKEKFSILQRVNKDWKSIVRHPEFNQSVSLFLKESNSKNLQTRLYRKYEKNLHVLFTPPLGLWSQLKHISVTGLSGQTSNLLEHILQMGSALESLELIRPDPQSVYTIVEHAHRLENLSHISISEVEMESLHEIDFFSFPSLSELILDEVFLVKDHSVLSLTPPSPSEDSNLRESHNLKCLDLYILPFSELLNFFKITCARFAFPSLLYLRVRCLSTSQHADQLATVIDTKVPQCGWSSLSSIEFGIVTDELVESISSKCNPTSLRKIIFPSRLDVTLLKSFNQFANRFGNVSDLTVRIKSSSQLEQLAEVIRNSPWRYSITSLRVSWSVLNSISVTALAKLRISFGKERYLRASARMVEAKSGMIFDKESTHFDKFFRELCKDRIVCECEECASSGVNDAEHITALAEEEWETEIPKSLRDELIQLYQ